ncbi:MAG: hypothetical protein KKI20_06120 [Gammaproteobacteria bacterium]|nr:hypothetical protein [Gammaproteobacteria bacterium]
MNILTSLRQLKYPKEFRIASSAWTTELLSAFEKLTSSPRAFTTEDSTTQKEQLRFLADVGTGLWRLRQKMVQTGTDRPLEEMRRAYRHLESTWDALTQAGVEIQDHTNTLFDTGMSLKVIAFQPTPGIGREKIIETIKPTIYFKKKSIQMGEVIVGTPKIADQDIEDKYKKGGKGNEQSNH